LSENIYNKKKKKGHAEGLLVGGRAIFPIVKPVREKKEMAGKVRGPVSGKLANKTEESPGGGKKGKRKGQRGLSSRCRGNSCR